MATINDDLCSQFGFRTKMTLQIKVDYSTISLYVEAICKVMETEPQRIKNSDDIKFLDTQTNVCILIKNKKWAITIPGSKTFILDEYLIDKLSKSISKRENALLLEIHQELFEGKKDIWKIFIDIQQMRKEKPMMEEAWQQLMTVYALNMDGGENVS